MADVQLASAFHELLQEPAAYLRVHEYALHRNADLSRMRETAGHASWHGFVEVRVVFDDDRGIGAQLERHALHTGKIADAKADIHAAGERDHGDAWVEHQHVADSAARPRDDVQ